MSGGTIQARAQSADPVLGEGQCHELTTDLSGRLRQTTAGIPAIAPLVPDAATPDRISNGGPAFNVKAAPGTFLGCIATNGTGATAYFQVFDLDAPPGAGVHPIHCVAVPAGGTGKISRSDVAEYGDPFTSRGISCGWSSTADVFTSLGLGSLWASVFYK